MAVRKRPKPVEDPQVAQIRTDLLRRLIGERICKFANGRCDCKELPRERICERVEREVLVMLSAVEHGPEILS